MNALESDTEVESNKTYQIIHTWNRSVKLPQKEEWILHKASFPFTKGSSSHCSLIVVTPVSVMVNEMIRLLKKISNIDFIRRSLSVFRAAHLKKKATPMFTHIFFYFRLSVLGLCLGFSFCLPVGYNNDCPCQLFWTLCFSPWTQSPRQHCPQQPLV